MEEAKLLGGLNAVESNDFDSVGISSGQSTFSPEEALERESAGEMDNSGQGGGGQVNSLVVAENRWLVEDALEVDERLPGPKPVDGRLLELGGGGINELGRVAREEP